MKGDRTAEDDVSKYTTRKKQESREGEEKRRMRKGRKRKGKRSGGETYPYPARKRRVRDEKGRSDRIAVGAFPPVRLRMTPVDGLDYLRGNQPRQREGTVHARYSLSGSTALVPGRTRDKMRIRI
jgi:hypothetical protein